VAAGLELGAVIGNDYRVVAPFSTPNGPSARVYSVTHLRSLRTFVLELLPEPGTGARPSAPTAVLEAARVLAQVVHPGLVTFFDWGTLPDGVSYLIRERLHGISLSAYLARAGTLPAGAALRIAREIGEAMLAAHQVGVFHGALSAKHVFLSEDGSGRHVTKLHGFSLAMAELTDKPLAGSRRLTRAAVRVLRGMPGSRDSAMRQDVALLGTVLARVLSVPTGRAASANTLGSIAELSAEECLSQLPSSLPEEVRTLLTAMLSPQAAVRPSLPTVVETLKALEWASTLGASAAESRSDATARPVRQSGNLTAAFALGALLVGAGAYAWQAGRLPLGLYHSSHIRTDNPTSRIEPPYDVEFEQLGQGLFAVDAPHEMVLGTGAEVSVRIIADVAKRRELEASLLNADGVIETVRLGHEVMVELRPDGADEFLIEPLTAPPQQPVVAQEVTHWSWKVVPRQAGEHRLRIIAMTTIQTRGMGVKKAYPVKTLRVKVRVTESSARGFFWVLAVPLAALLLGLIAWRLRRSAHIAGVGWGSGAPASAATLVSSAQTLLIPGDDGTALSSYDLRVCLLQSFRHEADFDALLIDWFPKARRHTTSAMSVPARINVLLTMYSVEEIAAILRQHAPHVLDNVPRDIAQ
jgi:hypothetical protein